jgi:PTS system ascorbate-specific IIA component
MAGVAPFTAARVRVEAEDWRAAIRAAGELLVEGGAVEEHYPERCIRMAEEHGPYMVLAPGLALAHARPQDGASGLGLSAVTLKRPVAFGHPDNDPVDLVFAFGSPDKDQHVGLLAALAGQLAEGLDAWLRAAESREEAEELLEEVVRGIE